MDLDPGTSATATRTHRVARMALWVFFACDQSAPASHLLLRADGTVQSADGAVTFVQATFGDAGLGGWTKTPDTQLPITCSVTLLENDYTTIQCSSPKGYEESACAPDDPSKDPYYFRMGPDDLDLHCSDLGFLAFDA